MKRNRRVSKFLKEEDTDPLSVVVNLFDVAMVFAVALMVAMVMHMNMTEVFGQEDFTIVKNPGKENMEINVPINPRTGPILASILERGGFRKKRKKSGDSLRTG
jgi:hypothetical protein